MTTHAEDTAARARTAAEARPVPDEAWPQRRTAGLPTLESKAIADATMDPDNPAVLQRLTIILGRRCTPVGRGWIVEEIGNFFTPADSGGATLKMQYCSWSRTDVGAAAALSAVDPEDRAFSGRIDEAMKSANFRVSFEVLPPRSGVPRGIVLFCPGITGWEYQVPVADELRERGWMVLTMVNLSSKSDEEFAAENTFAIRARARTLSRAEMQDPAIRDRCVAATVVAAGDFIADFTYAYEAALMYVEDRHPELRAKPAVIVACSLGAILAPTLSARLDDRVDAAVLVGGGADLCGILPTSGVLAEPLILRTEDRPVPLTTVLAEEIRDDYLASAPLDPYATAPLLASRPVLVIQGARDGIVKPEYGDLLWERLGRPERWVGNYGHMLLFYFLEEHAGEIADWLEGATATK